MRVDVLALAWVVLLGGSASARDLVGRYDVNGVAAVGTSHGGRARVTRGPAGLRLELVRDDGLRARGALVAEPQVGPVTSASVFRLDAPLAGASGLAGLGSGAAAKRRLQARFLRTGDDRLHGRWRVVEPNGPGPADDVVVAQGAETLTRAGAASRGRVRVAVSVDWEGRELARVNLDAMARLREALPGIPLTHFLNAAYLTKPGADAARVQAQTRGVVLPGDETGLHVHGWRTLVEAAGVTFRERPSFWGEGFPLQPTNDDLGHEVEIGAYPVEDLRKIVRRSRELMASIGFPLSGSFRAGGWMATPVVLHAIRAEGFLVDSSATDGRWHDELGTYRLRSRIPEVWPDVTEVTQPYLIETPAGAILEMPDTCALADYVTTAEMVAHLRRAAARLAADPTRDVFVHIGFHQETAGRFAGRVVDAVRLVAAEPGLRLQFETLEASAAAAKP